MPPSDSPLLHPSLLVPRPPNPVPLSGVFPPSYLATSVPAHDVSPPELTFVSSSPALPPKFPVQQGPPRPQGRLPQILAPVRRDKEGSPGPRSNRKNDGRAKGKSQSNSSSQPQTIVFDVSQPLDEIQAPRDAVKSTALTLVKLDPAFFPGSIIGATQWIAYATTRGRVLVVSRSSGDRTLLQLPNVFTPVTQVIDMAVYGNKLAGVTSDGGFVVWELPKVVMDDVPGHILLCIVPSADDDPLHSVKWHPKQANTLAVASETKIYLLDLAGAARAFRGEPQPQVALHRISQVFSIPSRLVAFDFDVLHFALATISEDSTLTLWGVHDKSPFWTHRVRGDDLPSSLTFIDDGIIISRKNGTVFQLLSVITKSVLSTVIFVNGTEEDPEMFGHVNYDSRIHTLWVANNRRDSLIALKIGFDVSASPSGELVRGGFFEQVIEFSGPKPAIHFAIPSLNVDPTWDEARVACTAAKEPPGELALVAYSVHSTGVDQVLVRKERYESALASTVAKCPAYMQPQVPASALLDVKPARQVPQAPGIISGPAPTLQRVSFVVPPGRLGTPSSKENESESTRVTSAPPDVKLARQIPQPPGIISGPASAPRRVSFAVLPRRLGTPSSEKIESELTRDKPGSGAERKSAKENTHRKVDTYDLDNIRSRFPGDLSMHITRESAFPVAAGGYADIYQGTFRVPRIKIKVAIKAIKVYSAEDNHSKKTKRLRREVKVWQKLNHTNVLSLFGTTSGFGPFPAMVCPWLENGTLTSYLERCGAGLEILRILALIRDVASGLHYLHSQTIVHGDLSGSNVLIDADGRACIADFGLSTILDEIGGSTFATSSTGKTRGTLRWGAPELLGILDHEDAKAQHIGPTIQSDIYSFGGIMLQILSGKIPYHHYSRDAQVIGAIFRGETPARPDDPRVTDCRWEFIRRCWSPFRIVVQRPSSEEIVTFSTDDLVGNSPHQESHTLLGVA